MHVPGQRGRAAVAAELGGGETIGAERGAEPAMLLRHADARAALPGACRGNSRSGRSRRGRAARRAARARARRSGAPCRSARLPRRRAGRRRARRSARRGRACRWSNGSCARDYQAVAAERMIEEIEDRGIERRRCLQVRHVAAARDAEVIGARESWLPSSPRPARGALRSCSAARQSTGTLMCGRLRALVEGDEALHGGAIGPLRHRRIALDEQRASGRIGVRRP